MSLASGQLASPLSLMFFGISWRKKYRTSQCFVNVLFLFFWLIGDARELSSGKGDIQLNVVLLVSGRQ